MERFIFVVHQDGYSGGMSDIIGAYLTIGEAANGIKTFIGRNDVELVTRRTESINGFTQRKVYVKYPGQVDNQLEEQQQWFVVTRVSIIV